MSLLDDVSIVVTPNGYKAGELYAVIPVPTEGAEEVTNGDFATADLSSFNTTYATQEIVSEELKVTLNTANGYGFSFVTFPAVVGRSYRIQLDAQQGTSTGTRVMANSGLTLTASITRTGTWSYEGVGVATATSCAVRLQTYGASGVYAIFDNVSVKEVLVPSADMDVTRATAATRVDENGLVNYAEVLGSEEIDCGNFECATPSTYWNEVGNSSLVVGDYQGRTNVANINILGTANVDRIKQDFDYVDGVTYLISLDVYLVSGDFKCDTSNSVVPYDFVATNITGSWQTLTGYFTAISTVTDGLWLRSSQQINQFYISNISVKEVTRDNVPRIDYTGGGCPHILAEPMRTNLITYSEDLTNAFYLKTGIETVTESAIASPDGTSFGYTIVPTSATSSHYFEYNWNYLTVAIGDEVTYSIFVKPNGYNFVQIATSTGFNPKYQNFELTGGGVIGTGDVNGKTIEKIGDWYRCSVTETSIGANPRFLLIPSETALATRNPAYSGNGTDGVLGWGVQVEEGSYATSYIPNFGTALGVTRNQDIFTRDGIGSLINSTEGVLFVEYQSTEDSNFSLISISDGTDGDIVTIGRSSNSTNIYAGVRSISVNSLYYSSSAFANTSDFIKVAVKWKVNDFAVWVNGTEVSTSLSGNAPIGLSEINFYYGNAIHTFNGKVKQLQVYNTALTDTQLAALTS